MKKTALFLGIILMATTAMAQLAANPWDKETAAGQQRLSASKQKSRRVVNFNGQNPNNVPLPDYVGEKTTWNTAMGQREIAPDVNITNMLLMTQHLRNVGYQIPTGLDDLINTAPQKLKKEIYESLTLVHSSSHPASKATDAFMRIFEQKTGMSIDNLITNSIRIIDSRR